MDLYKDGIKVGSITPHYEEIWIEGKLVGQRLTNRFSEQQLRDMGIEDLEKRATLSVEVHETIPNADDVLEKESFVAKPLTPEQVRNLGLEEARKRATLSNKKE